MRGMVESTRFLRNPLDVLAQQMVAIDGAAAARRAVAKRKRRSKPAPEAEIDVEEDLI